MKKTNELSDMKIEEISLVEKPANKKSFLFFKSADKTNKEAGDLKIAIESDGTVEGTKIQVNGAKIEDMNAFNFSFYVPEQGIEGNPSLSCSYSKIVEEEDGFKRSELYYLAKGATEMNKELIELLKQLFGDESYTFTKEELSADAVKALKEALATIVKYKDEYPDELLGAVKTLAKYATKEEKSDVTKTNVDATKVVDPVVVVPVVDPAIKVEPVIKVDPVVELTKVVTDLKDQITKDTKDSKDQLAKDIAGLVTRLDQVEKSTGTKKSIEGQDTNSDSVDLFPSI